MSVIYQNQAASIPQSLSSPPGKGLKIATIVFGAMGMITWAASIGFMLGWDRGTNMCYRGGPIKTLYGAFISVPANAASLYVTSRIIFLITSPGFPNPALLKDLRECMARLVTFAVVILTMWAASLSWLVKDGCEHNVVYHVCNYGFIDCALVAGFAGGLYKVTSKTIRHQEQTLAGEDKYALAPPWAPPSYLHHSGNYR